MDFIVELEKLLRQSGYKDWGIRYLPEKDCYREFWMQEI